MKSKKSSKNKISSIKSWIKHFHGKTPVKPYPKALRILLKAKYLFIHPGDPVRDDFIEVTGKGQAALDLPDNAKIHGTRCRSLTKRNPLPLLLSHLASAGATSTAVDKGKSLMQNKNYIYLALAAAVAYWYYVTKIKPAQAVMVAAAAPSILSSSTPTTVAGIPSGMPRGAMV